VTPQQVNAAVRRQRYLLFIGFALMFAGLVWGVSL